MAAAQPGGALASSRYSGRDGADPPVNARFLFGTRAEVTASLALGPRLRRRCSSVPHLDRRGAVQPLLTITVDVDRLRRPVNLQAVQHRADHREDAVDGERLRERRSDQVAAVVEELVLGVEQIEQPALTQIELLGVNVAVERCASTPSRSASRRARAVISAW
jgi:hypothetical protein